MKTLEFEEACKRLDELVYQLDKQRKAVEIAAAEVVVKRKAVEDAEATWPKKGDDYLYLISNGEIRLTVCIGRTVDIGRKEMGNCFRTSAEAEKEIKLRKVMAKLKIFIKGFTPDWDNPVQKKYYFYYVGGAKAIGWKVTGYSYVNQISQVYFASQKDIEHAIDALGDELRCLL